MSGGVKYIHRAVVNVDTTGTPTVVAIIHIFLIHVYYDIVVLNYCIVFHCFTVHFNSLNIISQQMHNYIIKH
jgi:hypothetical protein